MGVDQWVRRADGDIFGLVCAACSKYRKNQHSPPKFIFHTENFNSVDLYTQRESLLTFDIQNVFHSCYHGFPSHHPSFIRDFLFIIMHVYKAGEEMVVQIWMKKRIEEEEKEEEEEEKQRKR